MALFTLEFKSRQLYAPTQVKVLLPDAPSGTPPKAHYAKKFKVLWLLHGANSEPNDWLLKTNIGRYVRYHDVMVVMPTAINSSYSDYTYPGYKYWSYLNEELIPMIQGWFPASTDPKDNYIGGFSMGASGTMMLGFTRPELFGGLIILSNAPRDVQYLHPLRDLTSREYEDWAKEKMPDMSESDIRRVSKFPTVGAYLDSCENTWDRFSEVVKAGKLPKTFAGCGKDDSLYGNYVKWQEYAKQLGADITFENTDGYGHELEYWDVAIKRALEFFGLCENIR